MRTLCHFCGNKHFSKRHVQYTYKRDGQLLIVDEVPCEQCEYCGEQYFQADILKRIEKEFDSIYQQGKRVERELRIPLEHFSEIATI
jgi:YgiT-type zinc finger domain-containing protein